ncbi:hypothetical protein BDR22DRAFT_862737 [Usnea florida]
MKLTLQTLAFFLTLPSPLTLAAPTTTPPTVNITTNHTTTPPPQYYLQTRVKGTGNPDKNALYVSSYHTGAGLSDVTLQSIDDAVIGYLNGTNQQFNFTQDAFPWGLDMVLYDYYAEWDFVSINAGFGSEGFFFNETGLQYNQDPDGFAGWLACDWWHGVPQLFWKYFYFGTDIPSSCAEIDLLPVPV